MKNFSNNKKIFLFVFFLVFGVFFNCFSAKAIGFTPPNFRDLSYQGAYAGQSVADPITIEAGATKEVVVRFRNAGQSTWNVDGANFVSVFTANPSYRESVFASSNWLSKSQPTKISAGTKLGETGEFKIRLTAPNKTGDYHEDFYLAAQNLTWIKSGYFYLKIKVVAPTTQTTSPAPNTNVSVSQSNVHNFTRNLTTGMTGADVKELQKFLNNNGFVIAGSGPGSKDNETTTFGSLTKNALARFQSSKNISPAVGYFGPLTRNAINQTAPTVSAPSVVNNVDAGNSTAGIIDQATAEALNEYSANLVAFSARRISAVGGEVINFKVRYLNRGTATWNDLLWQEAGSIRTDTNPSTAGRFTIADSNWRDEKKITTKSERIEAGGVIEMDFTFRIPRYKGEYIARFQLTANGHTLEGGILELPITVTADAPTGYMEPIFAHSYSRPLIDEPKIRVGLFSSNDPVDFSSPHIYQVWSGDIFKGELPANEKAKLSYLDGLYTFSSQSLSFNAREKIRLVPRDINSHFVIDSYTRRISWKGNVNFNAYRNTFEYVFSNRSAVPWVVNELMLDEYVAGIGETSDGGPMEYIKAILVAARSYAYFHMNYGVPADQRTYDVVATTVDQLYLGYNSELAMPRVVQAARVTYGEMVTHGGTPVVTPYFANSDGKTRGWKEVWGGTDKPWIVSVDCLYDKGKTRHGHGVGMSAQDAAARANRDSWTYDQLLKYYYTGTSVERVY